MRHALAFLVLAAPLLGAADGTPVPDGIEIDTKIDRVTVYSDRARVTRTGSVAVKDGRQRILVSGLPYNLDADSVSAAMPGKTHGARILSIEVEDAFGKRVDKKEAEALIAKNEELQRKVKAVEDELGALAEEEAYLRSFQVRPRPDEKGRSTPVSLEPAAWQSTLAFVTESLASTLERTRAKQKQRKDLLNEIQAVNVELQKVATYERTAVKRVALEVEGSKSGSAPLEVTYAIAGPGWRPSYDVRVLSSQGKVEIVTNGVVRQSTGEDWTNVDLTLSTAFPEAGADVPELLAWRLGDEDQYAVAAGTGKIGNMDPGRAEVATATTSKQQKAGKGNRGAAAPSVAMAPPPPPAPMMEAAPAQPSRSRAAPKADRSPAYEAEEDYADSASAADESYYDGDGFGDISTTGHAGGGMGYAQNIPVPAPTPRMPPPAQIKSVGPGLWSLPAGRAYTFVNRENAGFAWSGDVLYCPSPRVSAGGFDYSFKADRRRTVTSDNKERKVRLTTASFPAQLLYEVVAPMDKKAYLKTTVKNETRQPFLAGEGFVFLDEDFVGRSFFSTVAPTAPLELSLGVDEDIKIDRRLEQSAETTGFIGKKDRTVFTVTVSVKSYKKRAVELLLRDQLPTTWQKEDISVEKLSLKPEPVENKTENAQGLYAWKLSLPAGGKEEVKLKWAVEHPRDFDLVEQRN